MAARERLPGHALAGCGAPKRRAAASVEAFEVDSSLPWITHSGYTKTGRAGEVTVHRLCF